MNSILDEIKPETVELLATLAKAHGLSVDEYLRSVLLTDDLQTATRSLSPQEKSTLWREWIKAHSVQGVIADDSRESIYRDREEQQL